MADEEDSDDKSDEEDAGAQEKDDDAGAKTNDDDTDDQSEGSTGQGNCLDPDGSLPAKELRNEAKGPLGNRFEGKMYYKGDDKVELVKKVQNMLLKLEISVGDRGADGDFGKDTKNAVVQFQKSNKDWENNDLKPDGLVGPRTSDSLNRKMVGILFECYQTPTELATDPLLITATRKAMESGFSVTIGKESKAHLTLKGVSQEHSITLLDSDDQPFSFDGQADCTVKDSDGNTRFSDTINSGDPIEFKSPAAPSTVELRVDGKLIQSFALTRKDGDADDQDSDDKSDEEDAGAQEKDDDAGAKTNDDDTDDQSEGSTGQENKEADSE